jgi:hypothetical protein
VARLGHVRLNDDPDWDGHGEEVVLIDGDKDEGLARLVWYYSRLEENGHKHEAYCLEDNIFAPGAFVP